jgi:small-conductance mechanosensitive channel
MPPQFPQFQATQSSVVDVLNYKIVSLLPSVVEFVSNFFIAIVVFLLGFVIASILRWVVRTLLEKVRIVDFLKRSNLDKYFDLESFNWENQLDRVLADIVYWFVLIVFLMTSFDILGFQSVNNFIEQVVNFLPRAVSGGLILLAGFIFGDLVKRFLVGFFRGLEKKSANVVASVVKWTVIILALMAAFNQWQVAPDLVNILAMGLVLFLALAGGLSFGLGGQETAKEILDSLKRHLRS